TILQNESNVRIGYVLDPPGPSLTGQRKLRVTDAENHSRTSEFLMPRIVVEDEFENLFFRSDDIRSTPFLVLYQQLKITHPTNVSELFTFDPNAGMAVKEVQDYSGNITTFLHEDPWTPPPSISWIPPGYYTSFYSDPTKQINARNKEKVFKYTSERILREVIDEENRRTVYDIQPGTGLRMWERIYWTPNPLLPETLLQETQMKYESGLFPGFMTEQIEYKHATDPAWSQNLVTQY